MRDKPPTKTLVRFRRLPRKELPVDTIKLARYLVGKTLVHDLPQARLAGRIVETEAYPIGDAAAHSFRGETPRNRSLFLNRGYSYVYFTYGSCWCMNVSSEKAGVGGGVLLRAMEPIEGLEWMEKHRETSKLTDIARGPGRLAAAMAINRQQDGIDLCSPTSAIWLADETTPVTEIGVTTRIGLSREAHRPLRFYERGSRFVSGPRRALLDGIADFPKPESE